MNTTFSQYFHNKFEMADCYWWLLVGNNVILVADSNYHLGFVVKVFVNMLCI